MRCQGSASLLSVGVVVVAVGGVLAVVDRACRHRFFSATNRHHKLPTATAAAFPTYLYNSLYFRAGLASRTSITHTCTHTYTRTRIHTQTQTYTRAYPQRKFPPQKKRTTKRMASSKTILHGNPGTFFAFAFHRHACMHAWAQVSLTHTKQTRITCRVATDGVG